MNADIRHDRLVLIKIDGMHCHKCEQAIRKALMAGAGVHEVEVDFASGQASILFNPGQIGIAQLMESVRQTGYKPVSFTQRENDSSAHG